MDYGTNSNSAVYYTGKYWNDYPECLSIINTRLFGQDIDWKVFLKEQGLQNFNHALFLNCGNGWVERELMDHGICMQATAVEYSDTLIEECNNAKGDRNINYVCHDINTVEFADDSFDLVINFAACHHIRYLERVCNRIRGWLRKDGYFIHNDYIGPQRNQYTKVQWTGMSNINQTIPLPYRKHLGYPDVMQMMIDDPTEAINSNRIIPTIYELFDIVLHTKSGGAIAYELLTHNDRLFNAPLHERERIVKYLMEKDGKYLKATGDSFFHFIISKNSKEPDFAVVKSLLNGMEQRETIADETHGHYCYNTLDAGDYIECSNGNSHGKSFFVHGFSNIEPTGRWSCGDSSIIRFKYEDTGNNKLLVHVTPLQNNEQGVTITTNGKQAFGNGDIRVTIRDETVLELLLQRNEDYPNEAIIVFNYHNVKTPKELGLNNDDRKLSLFFKWIKLE